MLFGDVLPKQLKRLVGRSFRVSGFGFRMDDEAVSRRTFCRMRGLASKGKDILLPSGKVSIDNIAARQHMSVRTLQRRLRDWGFAFEEIVDDVRRTEAIRHVLAGENSAMEIAFLLGYSDHSHFTRAFKRWTGLSPRDYVKLVAIHVALPAIISFDRDVGGVSSADGLLSKISYWISDRDRWG